ncbi:aldehyde dehydrogenase [Nocardia sp. 852002-20019_SCH5090214]|uniref:Aldehyde dehydrogenase family protein n=1 Tax=Nocardia nova TaxID=37330 RepID=A0A2S6AD55_9NOCA|nr:MULTISPECIES: aldehyde dehydrogenase family protein [Nocardia]OBA46746.1 aldehyde dehydrogenase [Nocardia sp. 852002-20019_SCH5090214]PPJ32023.1 aldehyde dehydrogenase family protein [Nocardia nova]
MREYLTFYIGGQWVEPATAQTIDVINPATERVCGKVAAGSAEDVDRAVAAARGAFETWSATTVADRLAVLRGVAAEYQCRRDDLAAALTEEMGAPAALAGGFQVDLGAGHLDTAIAALAEYSFEQRHGASLVVKEPIGVCGLITPWNWPLNQIAVKVFPALATGCTVILKPSEQSPFTGQIFAEILDAAGVPAGVFNLVQGDGPGVGVPLSGHPGIDMISFTGSTRAGIDIARNAAPTVKRVTQELGGKSPNIVLDDADFATNVAKGVVTMMNNSGQTCSAGSRMLVPAARMNEAIDAAREAAAGITVGDPTGEVAMGPVVSGAQFDKIQALIRKGIEEGATLVTGGTGRPDGLEVGFYVKPTVFADVSNEMTIAREEIFGPVLTILGYDGLDHAIEIANDTEYGLAGFVAGADLDQARAVARRIRAGSVAINDGFDFACPFGGYRKSGNGREWGAYGFEEYLETKAILGYAPEEGA